MQKLLVAEDDAVMHAALTELLTLEGYQVVGARCVSEALALMAGEPPVAAVIDWQLGLERTDRLLVELVEQGIPTVLLSAHPAARAVAERLGIPCVHKPFVVDQLMGILGGAISRSTQRKIPIAARAPRTLP